MIGRNVALRCEYFFFLAYTLRRLSAIGASHLCAALSFSERVFVWWALEKGVVGEPGPTYTKGMGRNPQLDGHETVMGYLMTTFGRTIVVVSSALHISRRDALFWVHGVLGSYSWERVKYE